MTGAQTMVHTAPRRQVNEWLPVCEPLLSLRRAPTCSSVKRLASQMLASAAQNRQKIQAEESSRRVKLFSVSFRFSSLLNRRSKVKFNSVVDSINSKSHTQIKLLIIHCRNSGRCLKWRAGYSADDVHSLCWISLIRWISTSGGKQKRFFISFAHLPE